MKLREYQKWCLNEAVSRLKTQSGVGLLLDMGLGKTVITLQTFLALRRKRLVKRALILAPKRVCQITWPDELEKWPELRKLSYVNLAGLTARQRSKAIATRPDVCICTLDGVTTLPKKLPFDMLICDESTAYKTWGSQRTKALKKLLPNFKKQILLTASPMPNSPLDIFAQAFLLDGGKTFGRAVTRFKSKYGKMGGFKGYQWIPNHDAVDQINEEIEHLVIRMDANDHLDVPEMLVNDIYCELDKKHRAQYQQLEDEMWLELDGLEVIPMSAGARYMTCKQFTGGGVYHGIEREVERIHNSKLDALAETVESCSGSCLVAYQYQWEHDAIRQKLKGLKIASINGETTDKEFQRATRDWNAGKLDVLLCQPQGVSHGVNLQHGGLDIIWFGLTDNPDVYHQFNGRVHRSGVRDTVRVHRLLVKRTVDIGIANALERKTLTQKKLLDFLRLASTSYCQNV